MAKSLGEICKKIISCQCFTCCPFGKRRISPNEFRTVIPNHLFEADIPTKQHPNLKYRGNGIKTTKYSLLSFVPKNLFEQFHRFANLYFIFIVVLNWIPAIEAFGRELSMIPIVFVLTVTAVKDVFEDWRRYKSDQKINHSKCRVWDNVTKRYTKKEWKDVIVGDFIHLSGNEIIPADLLLIRSSDPLGICYVETSNLDGESNLKQRQIVASQQSKIGQKFEPTLFRSTIHCEQPNNQIYRFSGFILHEDGTREAVGKNNLLLRGCEVRNTDYVEAIVLYAGRETKAMLNNSGPRYKRSSLERDMNWDIVWCVVILLGMCVTGAVGSALWINSYKDPYSIIFLTYIKDTKWLLQFEMEGFINFWTFIIVLQVMIPISLYVSVEIIKLGQIYFVCQDRELYYEPCDRPIQCRALNIPEELGQIQYVLSDKTGTLTENQMLFRRCAVAGVDYGLSGSPSQRKLSVRRPSIAEDPQTFSHPECVSDVKPNRYLAKIVGSLTEDVLFGSAPMPADWLEEDEDEEQADFTDAQTYFDFFINMAICNTVVVNSKPHFDRMNASGYFLDGVSVMNGGNTPVSTPRNSPPNHLQVPRRLPPLSELTPLDKPPQFYISNEVLQKNSTISEGETPFSVPEIKTDTVSEPNSRPDTPEKDEVPKTPTRPSSLFNLSSRLGSKLGWSPLLKGKKSSPARPDSPAPPLNPFYEAESPDELSLVYAASAYGMRLLKRQINYVMVELPDGRRQRYELLHTLPFDSDRKRMSVVVRCPFTEKTVLFCKGADAAIMGSLSEEFEESTQGQKIVYKTQQFLNLYSSYGLRTLCFAKRELSEKEYREWSILHQDAETEIENREQLIYESALKIEKDLQLLGCTGIEDRLQDGVPECIAALRHAGIKVWVLTGDKIETAVNIAYASRLFSPGMELMQLSAKNEPDINELLDHFLEQLNSRLNPQSTNQSAEGGALLETNRPAKHPKIGLVVDGRTLAFCLQPSAEEKFIKLVSRCVSVLCCRATPLQKGSVVKLVKEKLQGKTLAIGDGANDVSMIQCADVGVGISGQEGMQAVMASDFALARFKFLKKLLLVHGHWCYDRLARTVLYFFYKNALFVFCIFWYQLYCGFSGQVMIDQMYLMFFNLLFTSLPPLLMGMLDQDAPDTLLMQHPRLYSLGRNSQMYTWYSFWVNVMDALWQSLAIYFVAHWVYIGQEMDMWTFGFLIHSSLVLISSLHLATDVQSWTLPLVASIILSLVVYIIFSLLYNIFVKPNWGIKDPPNLIAERALTDPLFWLCLLFAAVLALLPRVAVMVIRNTLQPSDVLLTKIRNKSSFSTFKVSPLSKLKQKMRYHRKDKKVRSTLDYELV